MPKLMRRYRTSTATSRLHAAQRALPRPCKYAEVRDGFRTGCSTVLTCAADQRLPASDLLIGWRDSGTITEEVFNKVARGNAIKLLGLND